MENVQIHQDGDILTIKIDTSVSLGASKSGNSTLIANTHGGTKVGQVFVNLSVYKVVK